MHSKSIKKFIILNIFTMLLIAIFCSVTIPTLSIAGDGSEPPIVVPADSLNRITAIPDSTTLESNQEIESSLNFSVVDLFFILLSI